jgi:hypothetical protein
MVAGRLVRSKGLMPRDSAGAGRRSDRSLILSIVLVIGFIVSRAAHGGDREWNWFVATSNAEGWWIQKGAASVRLTDKELTATLYVNNDVWYRISGKRKGNDIIAKVSREGSDLVDYPLPGRFKRRQWEGYSSVGRETIALSDGDVTIGLVHEVTK